MHRKTKYSVLHCRKKDSQVLILFVMGLAVMILFCGFGLDAGLWYLDRLRLSRACDSSVITGVANFGKGNTTTGRQTVATKMQAVAAANYPDFKSATNLVTTSVDHGAGGTDYVYTYSNTAGDKTFVVTIATGVSGQITLARAEATTRTKTMFMGFSGISGLKYLHTKSSSEAQRRPRLMVLVLDRSGSMIGSTGGGPILPGAVTNFLGMFKDDPTANVVGIVSFSSFARVEMPLTTNFWYLGCSQMTNAAAGGSYSAVSSSPNPGGMKFGGVTCADEGIRLALEMMRTNEGFTNPQTVKFIVFFTDGQFNSARTLYAAPTWTNIVTMASGIDPSRYASSGQTNVYTQVTTNSKGKVTTTSTTFYGNTNYLPFMSSDSSLVIATPSTAGTPRAFTRYITTNTYGYCSTNIPVWLQPGAICVSYKTNSSGGWNVTTNWSYQTNRWITNSIYSSESNVLIVPGYVVDGICSGYLGIANKATTANGATSTYTWPTYPNQVFPDGSPTANGFRLMALQNYSNVISDLLIFKPEERMNAADTSAGLYYPGGMFYWLINNYVLEYDTSRFLNGIPRVSTNMATCDSYEAGSLFFNTTSAGATQIMSSVSEWKRGAPWWLTNSFDVVMQTTTNNRYIPRTFQGDPFTNSVYQTNYTGGGMIVKNPTTGVLTTNINTMAWNGRPTHYYNFTNGNWAAISTWTSETTQMLPLCNWKTLTYADYARQSNVIIYAVGFGADSTVLARMANDPSSPYYNSKQTIGAFYNCTTASQIATYFQTIAQKIQAFITQ
jgi:hypothetical protein